MTDALTDVLESLHMRGSVFSRASLSAPWGVESGVTRHGVFHGVVQGRAWARLAEGDDAVELEPGDVVLMPFGDNHLMTDHPDRLTRPIGQLTTIDANGMGQLTVNGGGAETSLICGTFEIDDARVHPVFSALPRIIAIRDSSGRTAALIETVMSLIADEVDAPTPGSEAVVARLTDVLIVYVLRTYINSLSDDNPSWLSGLRDPAIAHALGLIHREPNGAWSVETLAESVGLSRSAFHAKFRSTVGETPADYLTRWRIHLAARLLREEGCSVGAAARRVGYGTEAAFSNAFVRVMGMRPGAYKRAA